MRNFLLLALSLILFVPFFVVGYSIHLYKEIRYKRTFSMNDYNLTVSYQMDVLGCALIYNTRSHTLSAMAFEKDHWWFVYLINILFWDKTHCISQWKNEFN